MKGNKEDFFEQMKNYKTATHKKDLICMLVSTLSMLVLILIIILLCTNIIAYTKTVIIFLFVFGLICLISLIFYYILCFKINCVLFVQGKLSAGIQNLVIASVPIYLILIILYMSLPGYTGIISAIFTFVTTLSTAVLTIMGVYYTLVKRHSENKNVSNLIFILSDCNESQNIFTISNAIGNKTIKINLKNISNNFGYLIGLYRICGCNAYIIGDNLPYFPIPPQSSILLENIKFNIGDDQIILVYKDISDNYYYLLLSSNYKYIESTGICDMDFLISQIQMTINAEKKIKNLPDNTNSLIESLNINEFSLSEQKEITKPINVKRVNGFDLILSADGSLRTDTDLLSKLQKERIRIAKEQKVKAYIIFNNQQLVAMATYKPYDELSFISIYGLGKKKYDLYGSSFLPIIAEHQNAEKKVCA